MERPHSRYRTALRRLPLLRASASCRQSRRRWWQPSRRRNQMPNPWLRTLLRPYMRVPHRALDRTGPQALCGTLMQLFAPRALLLAPLAAACGSTPSGTNGAGAVDAGSNAVVIAGQPFSIEGSIAIVEPWPLGCVQGDAGLSET